MSNYKTTIKSNVQMVEWDKKEVKITCVNNKAGKTVLQQITQNASLFGGENYDIKKGLTTKDFTVKFKKKDHAEDFYNNVMAIVSDASVPTEDPVPSGGDNMKDKFNDTVDKFKDQMNQGQDPAPAPAEDSGNNTTIIIVGAVALVLVICLAIWAATRK